MASFKEIWATASPAAKQKSVMAVAVLVMALAAWGLVSLGVGGSTSPKEKTRPVSHDLLTTRDPKSLGIDGLKAELELVKKQMRLQAENTKTLQDAMARGGGSGKEKPGTAGASGPDEAGDISPEDQAALEKIQNAPRSTTGQGKKVASRARGPIGPDNQGNPEPEPPAKLEIKTVGERDEDDDSKVSKKGNDDNLVESVRGGQVRKSSSFSLPMGSMLEGTLITGLDAPTASQAKQQPFPALFRVKHEALLPNRWRTDIRECFLIASGYGDLASERAYLRAEAISCVRDDGTMMESIMDAFATGEDGKNGLRGRLVSKQGAMIGQALMGGFIQGIANIYKPARVPQLSLTANQTDPYSRPSPELALQEGLGSGMQSAGKLVADYYIDLARHTFPIIEIDAGRKVTFIVARTANVATRKATGKSGMATPNQSTVGMPNTPVGNMINRMTN